MDESVESLIGIDDFDFSNAQDVLDESGYRELSLSNMMDEVVSGNTNTVIVDSISCMWDKAISDITTSNYLIITLLIIGVFSAVFSNLSDIFKGKTVSDSGFYVCYMTEILILFKVFQIALNVANDVIFSLQEYMNAMIPTFILTVGVTATTTAITFYQILLMIMWAINTILGRLVIPGLKLYVIIALCNNISKEDVLSKSSDLIWHFLSKLNKVAVGIVAALSGLQGMILPKVDGLKNTVVYKMTGMIPVIGDSSSYLTEVFLGTGKLIKNSAGMVAIITILVICAIPVIKLFIVSFSLNCGAALIQPVADKRIVEGFVVAGKGISLLMRTVLTVELIFIISIGIICMVTG